MRRSCGRVSITRSGWRTDIRPRVPMLSASHLAQTRPPSRPSGSEILVRRSPRCFARKRLSHLGLGQAELPAICAGLTVISDPLPAEGVGLYALRNKRRSLSARCAGTGTKKRKPGKP
jgi:hypothetical protein